IFGLALDRQANRLDFPTLGRPTIPTSASILSSKIKCLDCPVSPFSENRGAWFVDVAKVALPLPPLPPRATSNVSPGSTKSPKGSPVSASQTIVPQGTSIIKSSPSLPDWFALRPSSPDCALNCVL